MDGVAWLVEECDKTLEPARSSDDDKLLFHIIIVKEVAVVNNEWGKLTLISNNGIIIMNF